MKILVCGGRDFADRAGLFEMLDQFHEIRPVTLLIHGGAWGADNLAGQWAIARNIPYKAFPADWHSYGRSAGAIRNQQMLDEGCPDYVVTFPGGKGTADMVKRAKAKNLEVFCLTPAPTTAA